MLIHQFHSEVIPTDIFHHPDLLRAKMLCFRSSLCIHFETLFLEIYTNTGNYIKTLGELDITNVNSDGDLFRKAADIYNEKRAEHGSTRCNIPKRFGRIKIPEISMAFSESNFSYLSNGKLIFKS